MWRYFSTVCKPRFLEILPHIVKCYNNSYHSSIGCNPANVKNLADEVAVWDYVQGKVSRDKSRCRDLPTPTLKPGTPVRISTSKGNFGKGYEANWTREIFYVVRHVRNRYPVVYKLRDYAGDVIKGTFYSAELQAVPEPETYAIETILKERVNKVTGDREVLVRWKGYPSSFDQWIPKEFVTR